MGRGVAGVIDHQADENHHVRQSVQRGIQKPAKSRNTARKPGDLPVEHVKKVGYNQRDAGGEEPAQPKKKTATDV